MFGSDGEPHLLLPAVPHSCLMSPQAGSWWACLQTLYLYRLCRATETSPAQLPANHVFAYAGCSQCGWTPVPFVYHSAGWSCGLRILRGVQADWAGYADGYVNERGMFRVVKQTWHGEQWPSSISDSIQYNLECKMTLPLPICNTPSSTCVRLHTLPPYTSIPAPPQTAPSTAPSAPAPQPPNSAQASARAPAESSPQPVHRHPPS
jgi:hypothetical protein